RGGVAPADRRLPGKTLEEAPLAREAFELRARVGDRHEELAAAAVPFPEKIELRTRLQRRSGLRRGDKQRSVEVEHLDRVSDHGRVSRIEHVQRALAEAALEHDRRQA